MKMLLDPGAALMQAKKEKSLGLSVGLLVVAAVLFAIFVAVAGQNFASSISLLGQGTAARLAGALAGALALTAFVLVFVGGLFYGYIVQLVMNTLGGKGQYFEGLTPVAYTSFLVSVGMLVGWILSNIPTIGAVLGAAVAVIFGALGIAAFFRGVKELFGVDYLTALIGSLVIQSSVLVLFFALTMFGLQSLSSLVRLG